MSRQLESKRRHEVSLVRQLQSAFPGIPQADPVGRDKPDVCLPDGPRDIGIEVSRLFFRRTGARPQQEQDSLRQRLCQVATALYSETGRPAVIVKPHFTRGVTLDKRTLRHEARQFALAVALCDLPSRFSKRITRRDVPELPRSIAFFSGRRCDPSETSFWLGGIAGAVNMVRPEHIMELLARKEAKLKDFHGSFAEHWMLVAVAGWTAAALAKLSEEAASHTYMTSFQRVFYLDTLRQEFAELNARSQVTA